MSTNTYKISIHTSRENSVISTFYAPFVGCRVAQTDEIRFSKQKIVITAVRSKKFPVGDILYNKNNSLYLQILKSIVYLYAANEKRIRITKVEAERSTTKIHEKMGECSVESYEQPLSNEYYLREPLIPAVLNVIWLETRGAYYLRAILSHFFGALSSDDRFYVFERTWRAFEQLCFYHNRAASDNNEINALAKMREYITNNTGNFADSLMESARISGLKLRSFDWAGYVSNSFKTPATARNRKMYVNVFWLHFVQKNRDIRVIKMLEKIVPLRQVELTYHGVWVNVDTHISGLIAAPEVHNEDVLCTLLCRYAYFVRCKMFHGEVPDMAFSFSEKAYDNERINILNKLLTAVVYELLAVYDTL